MPRAQMIDLTDLIGRPGAEVDAALRERIAEMVGAVSGADGSDFPCQAEPMQAPPPRLLHLLYRLLRDEVPSTAIEEILLDSRATDNGAKYSNPHLASLARAYCTEILQGSAEEVLQMIRRKLEERGVWQGTGHDTIEYLLDERTKKHVLADEIAAVHGMLDKAGVPAGTTVERVVDLTQRAQDLPDDGPMIEHVTRMLEGAGAIGDTTQARVANLIQRYERNVRNLQAADAKVAAYRATLRILQERAVAGTLGTGDDRELIDHTLGVHG
jgi:hypothetical protein